MIINMMMIVLTSMRSERSSTKYFWMDEFAASMQRRYSFLALVAFRRASSYFCFRFCHS